MLVIRLIRTGKRNAASFRVILVEKTASPKSGKFLEILGNYNPRLKELNLKHDRIKHWLAQGVKTSDTVHNLLVKDGIIKEPKIKKKLKSKKIETKAPEDDKKGLTKSEEKSKVEEE